MTADDVKNALAGPAGSCPDWVRRAALRFHPNKYQRLYETTTAHFFSEVTVRIETVKTAKRTGEPYLGLQRRRMDGVALVLPNRRRWEPCVIGLEIKVDMHDLRSDAKLVHYLDFCHMFYLAVPAALRDEALAKCAAHPAMGLLLVEAGTVTEHRPATLTTPDAAHLLALYRELWVKDLRREHG